MKKNIIVIVAFLISNAIYSQVGIGTTSPEAILHVNNRENQEDILKLTGNDTSTKMIIKENGTVIITPPELNNTLTDVLAFDPEDNSLKLLNTSAITSSIVSATGLERINETRGNGWRLIGRNPLNYVNIGLGAVDFSQSNSASSIMGAGSDYSFVGPGIDNSITGNGYADFGSEPVNHSILGGNFNTISEGGLFNEYGTYIYGGSHNSVNAGDGDFNFISGNYNIIRANTSGKIIGTQNEFGNGTSGASGYTLGTGNLVKIGEAYIFGNLNSNERGIKNYIIGDLNILNHIGGQNLILGKGNNSNIPYETIVGHFSENRTSLLPLTTTPDETYFSTTTDPAFRVAIGSSNTDRKDGLIVYRNGKVEIKQTPETNNTLNSIYARATDGSFALVDKTSILDLLALDNSGALLSLAYLNTTYGSKAIGYQVFSNVENYVYIKVAANRWVKYPVTEVF